MKKILLDVVLLLVLGVVVPACCLMEGYHSAPPCIVVPQPPCVDMSDARISWEGYTNEVRRLPPVN